MDFTPEVVESLFGREAAENEQPIRLKEYFVKNKVYESVRAELPLRLLVAHKGVGKSALFKICYLEDIEGARLSLWVRPDDIFQVELPDTSDLNQLIRAWKKGLTELVLRKSAEFFGVALGEGVFGKNKSQSGIIGTLTSFLADKASFVTDATKAKALQAFLTDAAINIYIDDLDRGWEGKDGDIRKISALLNAIRDLSSDMPGLRFRIALRADVYFLVRTSDESTDKIEGSVIWYKWKSHEIFVLLCKRIATHLKLHWDSSMEAKTGRDMLTPANRSALRFIIGQVFEDHFHGRGHWSNAPIEKVLLSLIRQRPRDLVKLCTGSAEIAYKRDHQKILTADLTDYFESYSTGRVQDTINEYKTELQQIERLLFGMKPSRTERRTADLFQYETGALLEKIRNIMQGGQFRFANGRAADEKSLAQFMYKINFITARKELATGYIDRKYFDENQYLSSKFVDFGYDWEVHPAYRWALQPDNLSSIFDTLKMSDDS